MKILQVVAYYPPRIGGMQNCVKEISVRLAEKGHSVEVFTSDIGCKDGKLISSTSNLKIHYLKSWQFAHTAIIPLVGDGEDKSKINLLIKTLKLENNVVLYGGLRGKRLYEIYSNSDILILTSIYESFGIVLIEAMASGLPIVASNILGVKNIVENDKNGLPVFPAPEDFAKAIEKLFNNSQLREKLIKNGFVCQLDENEIAKKVLRLLKKNPDKKTKQIYKDSIREYD